MDSPPLPPIDTELAAGRRPAGAEPRSPALSSLTLPHHWGRDVLSLWASVSLFWKVQRSDQITPTFFWLYSLCSVCCHFSSQREEEYPHRKNFYSLLLKGRQVCVDCVVYLKVKYALTLTSYPPSPQILVHEKRKCVFLQKTVLKYL